MFIIRNISVLVLFYIDIKQLLLINPIKWFYFWQDNDRFVSHFITLSTNEFSCYYQRNIPGMV